MSDLLHILFLVVDVALHHHSLPLVLRADGAFDSGMIPDDQIDRGGAFSIAADTIIMDIFEGRGDITGSRIAVLEGVRETIDERSSGTITEVR